MKFLKAIWDRIWGSKYDSILLEKRLSDEWEKHNFNLNKYEVNTEDILEMLEEIKSKSKD